MKRETLGKWAERYWPWAVGVVSCVVGYFRYQNFVLTPEAQARLLDKAVDVCAIGLGFWATATTLLLALETRDTVQALKTLGVYDRIVGYFFSSLYSLFALLAMSLLTIARGRPNWVSPRAFTATWLLLIALSAGTILRAFHLLRKLLKAR